MEEKNNSIVEHLITADGSSTLFHQKYGATFHSTKGARAESLHVFIKHGLQAFCKTNGSSVRILEYGFGTGLNVVLSINEAKKNNLSLEYYTIDELALGAENYMELQTGDTSEKALLTQLHRLTWDTNHTLTSNITFCKLNIDFASFSTTNKFDVIYYDAFAPAAQPNLWSPEMMQLVLNNLQPQGFMVTYCANGNFKRALKQLGFRVETLIGPPGKREMTRVWLK